MYTDLRYADYTAASGSNINAVLPILVEAGLLDEPFEHGVNVVMLMDDQRYLLGALIDDGPDALLEGMHDSEATHFYWLHTHDGPAEPSDDDFDHVATLTMWAMEERINFEGMIIINNDGDGGVLQARLRNMDMPQLPFDIPDEIRELFLKQTVDGPEDIVRILEAAGEYLTEKGGDPEHIETVRHLAELLASGDEEAFSKALTEAVEKVAGEIMSEPQPKAPKPKSMDEFGPALGLPNVNWLN